MRGLEGVEWSEGDDSLHLIQPVSSFVGKEKEKKRKRGRRGSERDRERVKKRERWKGGVGEQQVPRKVDMPIVVGPVWMGGR